MIKTRKEPRRDLEDIRRRYEEYIAAHKASGGVTQVYRCPFCAKRIETASPATKHDMWDTMTSCPWCDGLHYKRVYFTHVEARA